MDKNTEKLYHKLCITSYWTYFNSYPSLEIVKMLESASFNASEARPVSFHYKTN